MRDRTRSTKGRTFVFAGRRSTFKGSQTWWINPKSTEIVENSLRHCFANELRVKNRLCCLPDRIRHRFSASWRDPEHSQMLFFGVLRQLWGLSSRSGTHRRHAETLLRRLRQAVGRQGASQEAPGTKFASILGVLEPLLGPILNRFSHPMLHETAQCCVMLHHVARYCTRCVILRKVAQCCAVLHDLARHRTILHSNLVHQYGIAHIC